jgi:Double-GTPase 2
VARGVVTEPSTGESQDALDADDDLGDDDTLADEPEMPDPGNEEPPSSTRGRNRLELQNELVGIHSGQALSAPEASAILGQHRTEVIVALGEEEAGKTTLFASIYEHVVRGPVSGYCFHGSQTLLGFEDRSFDATYNSGNEKELTQRTSQDTERVALHLAVRHDANGVQHLLLGDVSGEHARTYIDYNDPGAFRPLLRSATRVLVLIDGQRLIEQSGQNATLSRTRTLIRALAEGGDLRSGTPIFLVVTKWDLCSDAVGIQDELDRLLEFGCKMWPEVSIRTTAARPQGEGIAELLIAVLEPTPKTSSSQAKLERHASRPLHRFVARPGLASRILARNRQASA